MSLYGRLEAHIEVHTRAEKFHDIFSCRPHHTADMSPTKIQGCDLHEGQMGAVGSVLFWKYVHDGVAKTAKEVIEAIDDANLSTTLKVIEGDMLKEFKNIKATVKATPKGEYSLVHWILEYERLNEGVGDPFSLLEFVVHVSRDIDDHHVTRGTAKTGLDKR